MTSLTDWISEHIPDAVMEDAAAWMAVLDSERCNEADRLSFARWLDGDPSHRWAFEELSEVWARLKTLADVEPMLEHPKVLAFPQATASATSRRPQVQAPVRRDWSTLAVALIVTLGVAIHVLASTPSEAIVAEVGAPRDVVLSDGSLLELNARTSMRIRLDDNRRTVEMLSGQAVFHVASEDRPFVVNTAHGSVTALGTSFDVHVRDGALEVSVIEGEVAVKAINANAPLIDFDHDAELALTRSVALLESGEWIWIAGAQYKHRLLGTREFARRLSWRNGVVEFENEPLHKVIAEMRRYTGASMHVVDSELSGLCITGQFETRNIVQFLSELHEKYGIIVDKSQPDWILLRSAPITASGG